MQGRGFRIFSIVAFLALSIFYLYPTFQNFLNQNKLAGMEEAERAQYEEANYDDLQSTRERALKLGLDLQGGMHVTLEVGVDALLRELATNTDDTFNQALAAAQQRMNEGATESFVTLFEQEITRIDPDVSLSRYFRNDAQGITRSSSNQDVVAFLNTEAQEAVTRAREIIRQRIDRFGVSEPSIQLQGAERLAVEMPGVTDAQRVRDLLRGTARLQFHLMADPADLQQALQRIVAYYETQGAATPAPAADTTATDSVATDTTAAAADTSTNADPLFGQQGTTGEQGGNPLAGKLLPGGGVVFAGVLAQDTVAVNRLLNTPAVRAMLPAGITLMYTSQPEQTTEDGQPVYSLLGVRSRFELTGEVLTDARRVADPVTQAPEVSLSMNAEGAQKWARITGANVDKPVAIVLDNVVYSYPRIITKISGGRTSITGVTAEEADDVVTVLKSGALPAPVQIVEERTVGPSLGQESITAGTQALLLGLLLVIVFMVVYYRTAGIIANLALLLNVFFIFGILAAFGATLTLPGIAGIVLTIGMAVDANVLIFERVREELAAGKTLKTAIEQGYDRALSSILDANITTFLVGVILYSFGVGPIQGFAVTLMAGILTSLFCALVITRLTLEYLVIGRHQQVAFE